MTIQSLEPMYVKAEAENLLVLVRLLSAVTNATYRRKVWFGLMVPVHHGWEPSSKRQA